MLKGVVIFSCLVSFLGCAGMKVVYPNDDIQKNKGTLALDLSSGTPKLVETFTCTIVASNGKRVSAIGKSEAAARNETLAKCRDQTIVSFCLEKNLKCERN